MDLHHPNYLPCPAHRNVEFKSANSWTLVFAIIIASIGLNINSNAVIIGAMLISPLMGPIVGTGYGLGINDFVLLKRSCRNLFMAVMLSLEASHFLHERLRDKYLKITHLYQI